VVANDGIDLVVEPGQVHCLLGENGAGKSTLMNVLYGLIRPDAGRISLDGRPVWFDSPRDAMAVGIGMVHQHFMLVPVFTVAENVVLGHEEVRPLGLLDRRRARRHVEEVSRRYGLDVSPDAVVSDLPVGLQQRVEILKALTRDAEVLILDEPTAVLTPSEIDDLFAVMRRLRDNGTSIVFITHKLKEVRALADRITVIRSGAVVGSTGPDTSERDLASLMVGRPVELVVDKTDAEEGEPVLEVDRLRVPGATGGPAVDGVSLTVRAGQIYALAGVQGNGQTELTEAIVGLAAPSGGRILLDGQDLTGATVAQILDRGVGYVPEDRMHDGLVGSFSVAENLVLDTYRREPFSSGIAMDPAAVISNAERRVREFDVRTPTVHTPASDLSGGNQQKVVLARELSRPLRLLVIAQPTRGLDVGSTEFMYRRIIRERDRGTAVLLISTELDEVLGLADRIGVMYRGRIIGELPAGAPAEQVGMMMTGTVPQPDSGDDLGQGSR
jgi:simple sugar transport system ATP-binding protein